MSSNYRYFEIPFENVPQDPTYTVWYATWSTQRPVLEPGMNPPMVVGVTAESTLPAGATLLGDGSKDPPPPPPSLTLSQSDYQKTVSDWLGIGRGEDE